MKPPVSAALANVLLRDATRLYPKLLLGFSVTPELELLSATSNGIEYPALRDAYLNMTVLFDPGTYLPHIIRVYEDHHIFGNSTNDYVVYNYTTVAGVKFPRRFKLMYNEDNLLIDFLVDIINVNPSFPAGFFDGLPENQINNTILQIPRVPAMGSAVYGDAEVFENRSVSGLEAQNITLELTCGQPKPTVVWRVSRIPQKPDGVIPCSRITRSHSSTIQ